MNQKLLFFVFAIMFTALGLTSCNSSMNDDDTTEDPIYQIVTISVKTDKATAFTFTNDKNELVTLTTSQVLNTDDLKEGERILIVFTVPSGAASGTSMAIHLIGYSKIINAELAKGTAEQYDGWMSYDIQQPAFWISGHYLNASAYVNVDKQPKTMALVADESTLGEKYPTLYFIYIPESTSDMIWRTVYASYDLSWLWSDRNYDGFVLKYRQDRGILTLKFEKTDKLIPVQPAN